MSNLTLSSLIQSISVVTTPTGAAALGNLSVTGNLTANGVYSSSYFYSNGIPFVGGGGGSANIDVSETAPPSPAEGDQWLNSATGDLSVYFGNAWVIVNQEPVAGFTGSAGINGYAGSAGVLFSNTAPSDTTVLWFDDAVQPLPGYTGSVGSTGYTGSSGVNGFTGSTGFTGSAATNVVGYSGSAGGAAIAGNLVVNGNLTVQSSGSLVIPVGTEAQRPATAANGSMRINTTSGYIEAYFNGVWFTVASVAPSMSVQILAVGGGGAGGGGGGGGAGGLLYYGLESVTNRPTANGTGLTFTRGNTYTVVVGAGGSGADIASINAQGGNTTVTGTGVALNARGGGAGATSNTTFGGGAQNSGLRGANGGSGGGAGGNSVGDGAVIPGGSGIGTTTEDRQGYGGGSCPSLGNSPAGGGGGAGAAGGNGSSGVSGAGGVGLQYSINGTATFYGGGGGGGGHNVSVGSGGAGGGGTGGLSVNGTSGTAGTVNTGGGGGGNSGNGGSGIVILRYASPMPLGTGGAISSVTVGGTLYQVHTFTTSGTLQL